MTLIQRRLKSMQRHYVAPTLYKRHVSAGMVLGPNIWRSYGIILHKKYVKKSSYLPYIFFFLKCYPKRSYFFIWPKWIIRTAKAKVSERALVVRSEENSMWGLEYSVTNYRYVTSRKHAYIMLTPLNPTFI